MYNYIGCKCDKCGEKFDQNSDIVVCPECGTPHHRECYNQLGHCVNQDKHAQGFIWQGQPSQFKAAGKTCPKCQSVNPKDAAFCENCGFKLEEEEPSFTPPNPFAQKQTAQNQRVKFINEEIEGIPLSDMAAYIGPSAGYYIFNFRRRNQLNGKYRVFCWSAFLFDGLYFLYRKMWKEAILILLVSTVLSIPANILTFNTLGIIPNSSPAMFNGIETFAVICSVLSFALKIFLGFIAVERYEKKVVRDLKKFKNMFPDRTSYMQYIQQKSGPSKIVLFLSIALLIYPLFL